MLSPFLRSLNTDTGDQRLGCSQTSQSMGSTMTWATSIICVRWPGIETPPLYYSFEGENSHFCLDILSLLSSNLCLLVSLGFVSSLQILLNNVQNDPGGLSWLLYSPNPAVQVFNCTSVDFLFYKQGPDGRSSCTDPSLLIIQSDNQCRNSLSHDFLLPVLQSCFPLIRLKGQGLQRHASFG